MIQTQNAKIQTEGFRSTCLRQTPDNRLPFLFRQNWPESNFKKAQKISPLAYALQLSHDGLENCLQTTGQLENGIKEMSQRQLLVPFFAFQI